MRVKRRGWRACHGTCCVAVTRTGAQAPPCIPAASEVACTRHLSGQDGRQAASAPLTISSAQARVLRGRWGRPSTPRRRSAFLAKLRFAARDANAPLLALRAMPGRCVVECSAGTNRCKGVLTGVSGRAIKPQEMRQMGRLQGMRRGPRRAAHAMARALHAGGSCQAEAAPPPASIQDGSQPPSCHFTTPPCPCREVALQHRGGCPDWCAHGRGSHVCQGPPTQQQRLDRQRPAV